VHTSTKIFGAIGEQLATLIQNFVAKASVQRCQLTSELPELLGFRRSFVNKAEFIGGCN
jgi:hypothetical protein